MLSVKSYIVVVLVSGLFSSCVKKNQGSNLRADDRITVDVGIDTVDPNEEKEQDKIGVDVGVDTVDPNDREDGSIDVNIDITTKPLDEGEDSPQNPADDKADLKKDDSAIKIFVEPQGMDIKLEMATTLDVQNVEICLGSETDCLANKEGLDRLLYQSNGSEGSKLFFRHKKAPSIDTDWTIIAKDANNMSLFYRVVKIGR